MPDHVVTVPRAPFRTASGKLEIHQIPAWRDNLVWLIVDVASREAAAVDGPEADGVLAYCEAHGLNLVAIFNTHTHPDHVGINRGLADKGKLKGMRVVGSAIAADQVPGITERVSDGDIVRFGDVEGRVMLTEGHINGHVSYVFEDVLFSGDTMFAAGCGYLFDGPPEKMHESLTRLAALDPSTRVCCAHEYTEDNLRFAWSVEPDNAALRQRIIDVWALRARGECSVPSTIGEERATNPFLRHASEGLRAHVKAAWPDRRFDGPSDWFAATRALKDRKDYKDRPDSDLPV